MENPGKRRILHIDGAPGAMIEEQQTKQHERHTGIWADYGDAEVIVDGCLVKRCETEICAVVDGK